MILEWPDIEIQLRDDNILMDILHEEGSIKCWLSPEAALTYADQLRDCASTAILDPGRRYSHCTIDRNHKADECDGYHIDIDDT